MSDDWTTIGLGGTAEEFLGEIIDRYREMMFRAARAITYNDDDADDVIQKLCVRFLIGGIPAGLRENPPAYLTGCIVNEAKNVRRTRERRRIDDEIDLREVSAADLRNTEKDLQAVIEEAKGCLTAEEREIVELYYMDGLAQAEIAEIKDMKEDAVAQKLSRSRKKMKKVMEVERRVGL